MTDTRSHDMSEWPRCTSCFPTVRPGLLRPALEEGRPLGIAFSHSPDDLGFRSDRSSRSASRASVWMQATARRASPRIGIGCRQRPMPSGRSRSRRTAAIVVWVSRRTVMEYAGIARMDLAPRRTCAYEVVDLTDVETEWQMPRRNRPDRPGDEPRAARIPIRSRFDTVPAVRARGRCSASLPRPLSPHVAAIAGGECGAAHHSRAIGCSRLRITHFDQLVLPMRVRRSGSRSPGWSGRRWSNAWDDDGVQTSDVVLAGADRGRWSAAGHLEGRGDSADWQHCEVRLPQAQGDGPRLGGRVAAFLPRTEPGPCTRLSELRRAPSNRSLNQGRARLSGPIRLRGSSMVSRLSARPLRPGGGRSTGCCWRRCSRSCSAGSCSRSPRARRSPPGSGSSRSISSAGTCST